MVTSHDDNGKGECDDNGTILGDFHKTLLKKFSFEFWDFRVIAESSGSAAKDGAAKSKFAQVGLRAAVLPEPARDEQQRVDQKGENLEAGKNDGKHQHQEGAFRAQLGCWTVGGLEVAMREREEEQQEHTHHSR
jgi:hypothetical protein